MACTSFGIITEGSARLETINFLKKIDNYKKERIEYYTEKGLSKEDAEKVVNALLEAASKGISEFLTDESIPIKERMGIALGLM